MQKILQLTVNYNGNCYVNYMIERADLQIIVGTASVGTFVLIAPQIACMATKIVKFRKNQTDAASVETL